MSESSTFHQVVPTIKKSTLDGHQILTAPKRRPVDDDADRPTQTGASHTRPALRSPQSQHETNGPTNGTDVVFRKTPIDARMQPGGVVVKGANGAEVEQRERRPVAGVVGHGAPARGTKILAGVVLTDAQRTLIKQLLTAHIGNVGGVQLSLAEQTMEALK